MELDAAQVTGIVVNRQQDFIVIIRWQYAIQKEYLNIWTVIDTFFHNIYDIKSIKLIPFEL